MSRKEGMSFVVFMLMFRVVFGVAAAYTLHVHVCVANHHNRVLDVLTSFNHLFNARNHASG